jgi:hypothetical protein
MSEHLLLFGSQDVKDQLAEGRQVQRLIDSGDLSGAEPLKRTS